MGKGIQSDAKLERTQDSSSTSLPLPELQGPEDDILSRPVEVRIEDHHSQPLAHGDSDENPQQLQRLQIAGRLASGVAHDFNNLLTVINGYTDLLLDRTPEGDAGLPFLKQIREAGRRATALTRQLLTLTRRTAAHRMEVDLVNLVGAFENMLRRVLPESIRLAFVLDKNTGRVKADPGQLEQVLLSLTLEARDALTEDGILEIRTANTELTNADDLRKLELNPGPYAAIRITALDQPSEACPSPGTLKPIGGDRDQRPLLGFGPSTIDSILREHGGRVAVAGQAGTNKTYILYLPRLEATGEPRSRDPGSSSLRQRTVLLVDDEPGTMNVMAAVLRQADVSVLQASSGEEALRIEESHSGRIDLLVTDLILPGISGEEVARRWAERRAGIPVLIVSGDNPRERLPEESPPSSTVFLQKPFSVVEFSETVRRLLKLDAARANP